MHIVAYRKLGYTSMEHHPAATQILTPLGLLLLVVPLVLSLVFTAAPHNWHVTHLSSYRPLQIANVLVPFKRVALEARCLG